jgi:hypothetical protein
METKEISFLKKKKKKLLRTKSSQAWNQIALMQHSGRLPFPQDMAAPPPNAVFAEHKQSVAHPVQGFGVAEAARVPPSRFKWIEKECHVLERIGIIFLIQVLCCFEITQRVPIQSCFTRREIPLWSNVLGMMQGTDGHTDA